MIEQEEIETIKKFLYEGDDITLPIYRISGIVEELQSEVKQHRTELAIHNDLINKLDRDSVRARNQIIYILLTLIATLLGKIIFSNEYIQHLIGK